MVDVDRFASLAISLRGQSSLYEAGQELRRVFCYDLRAILVSCVWAWVCIIGTGLYLWLLFVSSHLKVVGCLGPVRNTLWRFKNDAVYGL